jgi:galactokinase
VNRLHGLLRAHPLAEVSAKLLDRFDQFIAESNRIIPSVADALAGGRLDELGHLIAESQDLAERLLKNQVPETSFLAKSARGCGAIAASAFGAGFGGSVWALVRCTEAERFLSAWRGEYQERFPKRRTASAFFLTAGGPSAMDISTLIPAPA